VCSPAIALGPINPEAYLQRGRAYGILRERQKASESFVRRPFSPQGHRRAPSSGLAPAPLLNAMGTEDQVPGWTPGRALPRA
jgi:hypothetical protein